MRCYSHLSNDEREQIGRDRPSVRPSKVDGWRELSRNRLPSGRYALLAAGAYQCAGGMKRGSKETAGSQKGCQRQWETDPLGNSNLTNPPRSFLRQGGADANGGGTDGVGCPEEPRGRAFESSRVLPGGLHNTVRRYLREGEAAAVRKPAPKRSRSSTHSKPTSSIA
jgi:hypothetical protein